MFFELYRGSLYHVRLCSLTEGHGALGVIIVLYIHVRARVGALAHIGSLASQKRVIIQAPAGQLNPEALISVDLVTGWSLLGT